MANPPPLSQMQAQINSLIDAGWGIPTTVSRLSGTTDAAGHVHGSFQTLVNGERIWIQPISGRSSIDTKNLDAETSHMAYSKLTGTSLRPKDRLLPSGEAYIYDVIRSNPTATHRETQLKQNLRVYFAVGFFLLEDGSSHLLLQDGVTKFLLEG